MHESAAVGLLGRCCKLKETQDLRGIDRCEANAACLHFFINAEDATVGRTGDELSERGQGDLLRSGSSGARFFDGLLGHNPHSYGAGRSGACDICFGSGHSAGPGGGVGLHDLNGRGCECKEKGKRRGRKNSLKTRDGFFVSNV